MSFTAKPARSSWVQREALKRVHAALQEAGVAFASNAVTVRGAATGGAPAGAAAATRPDVAHVAVPG